MIAHERKPGPNGRPLEHTGVNSRQGRVLEGDVSEGSTENHEKFAEPHSASELEVTRLGLESLSGSYQYCLPRKLSGTSASHG